MMLLNILSKLTNYSKISKSNQNEGIITLADENYFEGLKILYFSIQNSYPLPVICYDIGLTTKQKSWAKEFLPKLTIKPVPDIKIITTIKNYQETTTLPKKNKRQWALWICPFLIQDSPFIKTFWMDCDLIVLRNLETLFEKLEDGPIFTPENLAPHLTANSPQLYQLLPIHKKYSEDKALINAGVSGWNLIRDKKILNDYANVVKYAFENNEIKASISWHDQGALIWAILNNGLEECVAADWKWNTCVKHTSAANLKFKWSPEILNYLQQIVPEANILHWNGRTAPWIE